VSEQPAPDRPGDPQLPRFPGDHPALPAVRHDLWPVRRQLLLPHVGHHLDRVR
jgi:hypothetical protein